VWLLSSTGQDSEDEISHWSPLTKASYMAESRWTALCARIKEDIFNLQRDQSSDTEFFSKQVVYVSFLSFFFLPSNADGISKIKSMAEENLTLLPQHFQLRTNIRECTQETGTIRTRFHRLSAAEPFTCTLLVEHASAQYPQ
jgi:hypothetical protein